MRVGTSAGGAKQKRQKLHVRPMSVLPDAKKRLEEMRFRLRRDSLGLLCERIDYLCGYENDKIDGMTKRSERGRIFNLGRRIKQGS